MVKGVYLFFCSNCYPQKAWRVQLWECFKTWTSWVCKLMWVSGVTSFIRKDSCEKFCLYDQEEVCCLLILSFFLQGTRGRLRKVKKMFCLCYTQIVSLWGNSRKEVEALSNRRSGVKPLGKQMQYHCTDWTRQQGPKNPILRKRQLCKGNVISEYLCVQRHTEFIRNIYHPFSGFSSCCLQWYHSAPPLEYRNLQKTKPG